MEWWTWIIVILALIITIITVIVMTSSKKVAPDDELPKGSSFQLDTTPEIKSERVASSAIGR